MRINTRLLLLSGLTLFGITAVAQQKDFRDENGTEFRASGWDKFLVQRQPGKKVKLTIIGSPVSAKWISQRLELRASNLEMIATEDFRLISANLAGGIVFTAQQSEDTMTVTAPGATYTDAEQKLVVNGALVMDQKSAAGDSLHAEGRSGTIFLDRTSNSDGLVKSANLSGPVVFRLRGSRVDEETKKKVPFSVNASAGSLRYSDSDKKAILEGNVKIDGNDPTLFGAISGVDKATITLSETREIESIEFEGNPGKTSIEQKSTTGGGGAGGRVGGRRKK